VTPEWTTRKALDMTADDSAENLYDIAREHFFWPLLSRTRLEEQRPLIMREGQNSRVTDIEGHEFVDLTSSLTRASALGYGRPDVIAAIVLQLERLHYAGTAGVQADTTIRLAQVLADLTPGDLVATSFSGSGSEANEVAFKLARAYHASAGKPRAFKVISRWTAYHGATGAAGSASDWLGVRNPMEPTMPGFSRIPAPSCFRCPFNLEYPSCGVVCADVLETEIQREGPELVSAFIAEPVMQANGVQVPPPEYLPRVRQICADYGVLFIADEVITGFGRTGTWFGVDHWGVQPYIMTMAKAITAGYGPLGATIATAEVRDGVDTFHDVHTFGGHALSSAAALAAIKAYETEDLVDRSRDLGARTLEQLKELEALEVVGEVRGLGMWIAVDLVDDQVSRASLPDEVLAGAVHRVRDLGVLVARNGTALEIAPPLTIEESELEQAVAVLIQVVAALDREHAR
jgi:putrescine---pyruvate transaminase